MQEAGLRLKQQTVFFKHSINVDLALINEGLKGYNVLPDLKIKCKNLTNLTDDSIQQITGVMKNSIYFTLFHLLLGNYW